MEMKKAAIEELASSITSKMRCVNHYIEAYGENYIEYPIYSMMRGMLRTLTIMGITNELIYDKSSKQFTEVLINGERFTVNYGMKNK